jgi:uncharacterized protein YhaN
MQIRDIHIEGFGRFRDRRVGPFQEGLNVIHGPNELGKTTLLEFVRRVLFGFPDGREKTNFYGVQPGSGQGGRLSCLTQEGETIHVSRQPGPAGGAVIIGTEAGDLHGDATLGGYIGHASKDIFRNIYAFTIDELQSLDSLSGSETQSRLYGAGLGSLSLAAAERELEKMTEALFKPRGSQQQIARAHKRIRDLQQRVRETQEGLGTYDEKVRELTALRDQVDRLSQEADRLQSRRHALQTRLDLFPMALDGQQAQKELDALEAIDEFPEHGSETLASLLSEQKTLRLQIEDEAGELEATQLRLKNLDVDEYLLGRAPEIIALMESTQEIRTALKDRLAVRRERDLACERIAEGARRIGPLWDEARAMAFTWSEAEQSAVQQQHRALETAREEVLTAREKLNYHREQRAGEQARRKSTPGWVGFFSAALLAAGALGTLWGLARGERLFVLATGLMLAFGLGLFILQRKEKPTAPEEDALAKTLQQLLERAEQNAAALTGQWQAWLRDRQLDPGLQPQDAERVAARIREIRIQAEERDRMSERLARRDAAISQAAHRLQAFAPCPALAPEDLPAQIQHLGQRLEAAQANQRETAALQTQFREHTDKIARLEMRRKEKDGELQQFLKSAGATGEEDLKRRQGIFQRRRELRATLENTSRQIQARLGVGEAFTQFLETLRAGVPDAMEHELEQVSEALSLRLKEKDALYQQIGETQNLVRQLASNDDLLTTQAELEMEKHSLGRLAGEWAAGRIALAMLAAARGKYEKDRQPQVLISAGEILSRVTGGKYVKVIKPIDSAALMIEAPSGSRLGIQEMSRGTREQLYLAMRLGLIEEYEKRSEPLPIIMDDVFINFDDARGERVVEFLAGFARPRQVIVMTCHMRSLEIYKKYGARQVQL